jgi:hypothetical protein
VTFVVIIACFHAWLSLFRRNMRTASELTAFTKATVVTRADYRGLSDHRPNVHCLKAPDGSVLKIGTWNVLNPKYVMYANMTPPPGKELPSFCTVDDQAGLENLPQFAPEVQVERAALVVESILAFFTEHPTRTVLCLQEAWPELEEKLSASGRCTALNLESTASFCLTLISSDLEFEKTMSLNCGHAFKLRGSTYTIANFHLCFDTSASNAAVKEALERGANIILGDFNVQTKPISAATIAEGSNLTLEEYVAALGIDDIKFLPHPDGWTVFNVRKNLAENREQNQDHFDNIMLMGVQAEAEPIDFNPRFY